VGVTKETKRNREKQNAHYKEVQHASRIKHVGRAMRAQQDTKRTHSGRDANV